MATPPTPFTDPAQPILAGDPALSDENRADLWDIFHQSKSPAELVQHLQPLVVPEGTKRKLLEAKTQNMPVVPPLEKAKSAISALAQIDHDTLDLAETHPNVLKVLSTAAIAPEKETQAASGGISGSGKGKAPAAAEKPAQAAPLVQPPRIDGQPHLPPIPPQHRRVLASDGGLHDIPEDRLEEARSIDPTMHVLNP